MVTLSNRTPGATPDRRPRSRRAGLALAIAAVLSGGAAGCSPASVPTGFGAPQVVTLTVRPAYTQVLTGQAVSFSAEVRKSRIIEKVDPFRSYRRLSARWVP